MPEKCNFLFHREDWPLTDFHYMYLRVRFPLLGMHRLDLSDDKVMDGALWRREAMHPMGQSFSLPSICSEGTPSHSWQPQKCSTNILSHNEVLGERQLRNAHEK